MLALPPLEPDLLRALFAELPVDVVVPEPRDPVTAAAVGADADLLLGDWSGALRIDRALLAGCPRLVFVQQPSAGVDAVDVEACTAAGIPVANAGAANAVSVAEWCLAGALAVLRWLPYGDAEMRAGQWPQLELAARGGGELAGRRVGIVGMGRIGRECALRFTALGCDVAHWSRTQRSAEAAVGARWLPLPELLAHSELLVVVIALAPQTRGLLGPEQLASLPPGAVVVDASRGGIVDQDALLAAVQSGALLGAALDVYAIEPLPANSPLRGCDRIVLSPHAAGASPQAQGRLITGVIENIRRVTSGEPPLDVVNGLIGVVGRRG